MIYKCEQCGERLVKGKLKHIIVCMGCYKVNDVRKLKEAHKAEKVVDAVRLSHDDSILKRILEEQSNEPVCVVCKGAKKVKVVRDMVINGHKDRVEPIEVEELCRGCDGSGIRVSLDRHRDGLD